MARFDNRTFFNSLGGLFGRMGQPITRAALQTVPQSGPVAAQPSPAQIDAIGMPIGSYPVLDSGGVQPEPQTAPLEQYGANVTPNEQTWEQPNADTATYTQDAGFGRTDTPIGSGSQATGYVRTNISPGSTSGGVSNIPAPMRVPGDTVTVRPGDTMKTVAQRAYGDYAFFPRLHRLQNTYELPNGLQLQAGEVLELR